LAGRSTSTIWIWGTKQIEDTSQLWADIKDVVGGIDKSDTGVGTLSPFTRFVEFVKELFLGQNNNMMTGMAVSASEEGSLDLIGIEEEVRIAGEQLFQEVFGIDVSIRSVSIGFVVKDTGEEKNIDFIW